MAGVGVPRTQVVIAALALLLLLCGCVAGDAGCGTVDGHSACAGEKR